MCSAPPGLEGKFPIRMIRSLGGGHDADPSMHEVPTASMTCAHGGNQMRQPPRGTVCSRVAGSHLVLVLLLHLTDLDLVASAHHHVGAAAVWQ